MAITQGVVDGVLLGGIYAVVAIGLTLLLGVVGIVNFAHGAFVMAGGYAVYVATSRVGLDPYAALLPITLIFFLIGVVYYRIFLQRIVGQTILAQALLTIGISLVLVNAGLAMFGPEPSVTQLRYTLATIEIGAITIPVTRLIGFLFALATTAVLYLLLWKTDFGVQVRAAAVDRKTAEMMGVNVRKLQAVATGISVACAGIGGGVLFPILYVSPTTADQFIFLSFLIVALGGLGSFFGALGGGVLIGIVQSLGSTYFDGSVANMLIFAIFVAVLLLRPSGLVSGRGALG